MNLSDLNKLLAKEPKFRQQQAYQAIFHDMIADWQEALTLPKNLREMLNFKFSLDIPAKLQISQKDKAVKALLTLSDGLKIETVLLQHKEGRNTVCVSSQVGCPLGCLFCQTGKGGFERNLNEWEIISQVLFFARYLKKQKQKVSNLVFMGMGEPFLNYDNVLGAIKILNSAEGLNIGARHISISTIGLTEGILKLANENLQVNLAVSLHAAIDETRAKIIPTAYDYTITKILNAVDKYIAKTNRRVMFEYLMIKDLNDSENDAQALAELMKKPLYFVNLISYNLTGKYKPSTTEQITKFKKILSGRGVTVTQRYRFGQDIEAACGQLKASSN